MVQVKNACEPIFKSFENRLHLIVQKENAQLEVLNQSILAQKAKLDYNAKAARENIEAIRAAKEAQARKEADDKRKAEEELIRQKENEQARIKRAEEEARLKAISDAKEIEEKAQLKLQSPVSASQVTTRSTIPQVIAAQSMAASIKQNLLDIQQQPSFPPTITDNLSSLQNQLNTLKSAYNQYIASNIITQDDIFSNICSHVRELSRSVTHVIKEHTKYYKNYIISVFKMIINAVKELGLVKFNEHTVDHVLLYTTIILSFYRSLSPNLASQISVLFQGLLYLEHPLLIPDLPSALSSLGDPQQQATTSSNSTTSNSTTSDSSNSSNSSNDTTGVLLILQASLSTSHLHPTTPDSTSSHAVPITSPFSVEAAWTWLSIVTYELRLSISEGTTNLTLTLQRLNSIHLSTAIHGLLTFAGYYLMETYTTKFIEFLTTLLSSVRIMADAAKPEKSVDGRLSWIQLYAYLTSVIKSSYIPSRCFLSKEPHVIYAYFVKWLVYIYLLYIYYTILYTYILLCYTTFLLITDLKFPIQPYTLIF